MGWLQNLKIKLASKVLYKASGQKTIYPSFTQFGEDIMKNDTVRTITNRKLTEFSKIKLRHIRIVDGRQTTPKDNKLNDLFEYPNPLMNGVDFMRTMAHLKEYTKNAFAYPTYDLYYNKKTGQTKKVYTAIYPLRPRHVDFYQDDSGEYYVDFTFANGEHSGAIPYNEVIHWREEYGANEFLGGDINGCPDNSALLRMLDLNHKLLESTFKVVEGSLTINGILKYGGLINEDDREKARLEFEEKLKTNSTGIIALDSGGDYTPVPYNGKSIDTTTLEFMDKKIRQNRGVSEAILNADYTTEQKEAFYETNIEADAISLGQTFSRVLFTSFERSNGNVVIGYTSKIQQQSTKTKIAVAQLLLPVGGVSPNQFLSWIGEPPYEGGDDRYVSLNWIRKDIADEYQLQKYKYGNDVSNSKKEKQDENNNQDEDIEEVE